MTDRDPDRIGVLLVNTGTPDAPSPHAVRGYLAQFLSDPRVIDIHPVGRWLLLHGMILRTRPRRSAAAYRRVWTDAGSPLRTNGEAFSAKLTQALGDRYTVALAMRYGRPSIRTALAKLRDARVSRVVVFPLFPQEASATTGSVLEAVYHEAGRARSVPPLAVVPAFFDEPAVIDAFAEAARPVLASLDAEHVVLSFHGLPIRHVREADPSGAHCLVRDDCCERIGPENRHCYRAQCAATARALASTLELEAERWTMSFQSRLGREAWLSPATDETLVRLAERGVKRVAVLTPSFVADGLETLEEIAMRGAESFGAHGGDELRVTPCLNDSPAWVAAAAELVRRHSPMGHE